MFAKLMNRLFGEQVKPGIVVIDRYDGIKKTVERIDGAYADVVWFEGNSPRRGRNLTSNLSVA